MKLFSLIVAFVLFVAVAVAIEFCSPEVYADYQPLPESCSELVSHLANMKKGMVCVDSVLKPV